ncbi:DASH family cryptochrome [Glaciecola siphonariae]|uniref:Cryptochrome DASH n=1 Tax=Glaciecola siphonariae TaxID=521012 RepID=A0ABV9LSH1_9ALTE
MPSSSSGLHWFRHDLRVSGNEALSQLIASCASVAAVYVFDPKWEEPNQYDCLHLGQHRRWFIESALSDLSRQLQAIGIELYVLYGKPVEVVNRLLAQNSITHISYEEHHGVYERREIENIQGELSHIKGGSNYLYEQEDFPFALENMPDTFSPFRRKVEKYAKPRSNSPSENKVLTGGKKIESKVQHLALDCDGITTYKLSLADNKPKYDNEYYQGGQSAGLQRIEAYFFGSDQIARYKETRNGLDGWDFSSRLSAFLAHGCVSPREVLQKLSEYERERVANDSTYWLFFELLWREFFHWQHKKHGVAFFAYQGIQDKSPNTRLDTEKYQQWCQGETGYDIVDACMRQLNATGFISNRGRQLVASCFVHELALDWRYGAAYFEQQLIDFDVASNWGNWQYLAGVGSDPRGHRQFNLQKQTDTYDPQRKFINKWLAR